MPDYPTPKPGLVIRYAYLWRREAEAGLIEGVKDRPCVVVLAVTRQKDSTRVVVAPITHSKPDDEAQTVKLTAATRRRLGLGEEDNWAKQHPFCKFAVLTLGLAGYSSSLSMFR